jgi:dihydroflavonol-4-reductase
MKEVNMKALVTGSTGMLGHNLVRQLLEQGWQVRALVRSKAKAQKLFTGLQLEVIEGDIENVAGFKTALSGVDAVFHAAAYFREYGAGNPEQEWATLKRINIDATLELMNLAESAGVKAFIHTSSSGTIGVKPGNQAGDETTPADDRQLRNAYFKSKVQCDQAITKWLETPRQLKVVTILPGWMFGPRDAAPTGAGALVLQVLHRQLPGILDAGSSITDPRDVANAMIRAVEHGRNNERYIVAGRYTELEQVFGMLERVSGVKTPKNKLPQWLLETMARVDELRAKLTNTPVKLPLIGIQTLHLKRSVSSAKAERELGATFRPLEQTLRDTVQWYRENGYVKDLPTSARAVTQQQR